MGDSLQLSTDSAVNGDVEHSTPSSPSGDLLRKSDYSDSGSYTTDTAEDDEHALPSVTASPLLSNGNSQVDSASDNEHEDDPSPENINCDDDVAVYSNGSHDIESVSDEQRTDTVCNKASKVRDADVECLDQVGDSGCSVPTGMLNSACDGGTAENQCSVPDASRSSSKYSSPAAPEGETVDADVDTAKAEDSPMAKFDENHSADAGAVVEAQLQLECEDDEVEPVSGSAECENCDSGPTSNATVAAGEDSPSLSTPEVSSVDVTTSSAPLLSTVVVINTPVMSSPDVPGLPANVAAMSLTPSSGAVGPTLRSSKPLTVSVPAASVRSSSSNTRQVSRLLQDVGLLLVSQKVFKNLASVQKQKLADSKETCDTELLRKLKTSHQNLAAKNHSLLMPELRCWCGFHSESVNVIEAHRVRCDFQGRCCYCQGRFVYRTEKQMMKHLSKVHKKVGNTPHRSGSLPCPFCPVDFSSRFSLMRHIDVCRQKFLLAANLAPKAKDKDIPVTAALKPQVKHPVPIPVMVASSRLSPVTVATTLSRNAPLSSPAVMPPAVSLQLAPPVMKPVPAPKLVQIGQQLFTLLPSTSVAASAIAVNKAVSQMALNSAMQTAQNASSALPVVVNSRSVKPTPSQASMQPASVSNVQYSLCPVCGAFVKDKAALLVHVHVAHRDTHKMCRFCCSPDVTFPNYVALQAHIDKMHTSDCWICSSRFQPPDRLIGHIADRHKETMSKMLELCRCYFCSGVPTLPDYAAFERHMLNIHSQQFSDTSKLWDYIVKSPNANRNWYAKLNPDGTLECPHCLGQFISTSFLYRHLHLEHAGRLAVLVNCQECRKRMPSSDLLAHLTSAHTRKCSVRVSRVDVSRYECVFVPPVGTKRKRNRKGEPASKSHPRPLKRVRTAETVIISDSDDNNDDDDDYIVESEEVAGDSSDEDFVLASRVDVEPRQQHPRRRGIHTRLDHRNSSVDDVHEVLESIVDSTSHSEPAAKRSSGFTNTSVRPTPVDTSPAAQLCNGITEDEVEIIESIVPAVQRRRPVSRPDHAKPTDSNHSVTDLSRTTNSKVVVVRDSSDRSASELADCVNGNCYRSPTEPTKSSAEQLMARDQIMVKSVEEVLEIDGETVLIVHDDDD